MGSGSMRDTGCEGWSGKLLTVQSGPAMPFFPTDLTNHGRVYGWFGDCCGEQRGTVLVGYHLLQCLLEGAAFKISLWIYVTRGTSLNCSETYLGNTSLSFSLPTWSMERGPHRPLILVYRAISAT